MVLQFLRGIKVDANIISYSEMAVFAEDIDYYGLSIPLAEIWLHQILKPHPFSSEDQGDGMVVSGNGLECSQSVKMDYGYELWVMGAMAYGGQDHVLITLFIARSSYHGLQFGVTSHRPSDAPYRRNPTAYGYGSYGFVSQGYGEPEGRSK